jgi:1,4-dihydroxy-2-naphthoate polyprenyltransferase
LGLSVTASPLKNPATGARPLINRLRLVFSLVRYRFFLYAGLLPYLLGAAWAFGAVGRFDGAIFWSGLGGAALAVIGVEAFNEYFDSRMGTDRVFNPEDIPLVSAWVLGLGFVAFGGALAVGVYLTLRGGWPILIFALLGGVAAVFYEAPPVRWSYRGLGEALIALSYGPWMVLGSAYLQTGHVSWDIALASLAPGFLIMALAVANAIPDFHQDRLVGKRNLVVRIGRRRAVWLYVALATAGLLVAAGGAASGLFPKLCLATLASLPMLAASAWRGIRTFEKPRLFVPAIRSLVGCYLIAVGLFSAGFLPQAWR